MFIVDVNGFIFQKNFLVHFTFIKNFDKGRVLFNQILDIVICVKFLLNTGQTKIVQLKLSLGAINIK